jgi:(1->4)-alpha-D-glucan 1-alpha-D-glucosylmutase
VKQAIIARALAFRRRAPNLFAYGGFLRLKIEGELADHALAFARSHEGRAMVVVTTRLAAQLGGVDRAPLVDRSAWRETAIILPRNFSDRRLVDVLGGPEVAGSLGRVFLSDVLAQLPVALLEVQ